jgi:hypothetical protein
MALVHVTGLLSAALMMGDGGLVPRDVQQDAATAPEPIYVSAPDQTVVDGSGDIVETTDAAATQSAGAVHNPVSRPVVSPETSAAVPDEGGAIELAISDDYIQARYYTGGGILGFDEAKGHIGAYFSDNRDLVLNVGAMTDPMPLFTDGLTFSAGGRSYLGLLSDPNDDVFAIAPGVEARYALAHAHPMYVVGSLFYAPDILTLGDADHVLDLDARFETQVVENMVGFVGYREFHFDSDEGGDKRAASEIQIGGRFAF